MRWTATAVGFLVLFAGCLGGQKGPGLEGPKDIPDVRPRPELSQWSAISHAEGSAALRVALTVPSRTTCDVLFAAHHVAGYDPENDLSADLESEKATLFSWGGDSRSFDSQRVKAGDADTRPVTTQVLRTVFGAFSTSQTFTSWVGLGPIVLQPGTYNLTVQAPKAVDGGSEETLGGSLRIAAQCKVAVRIEGMFEDPHARWILSSNMNGEFDVSIDPFLVDAHRGSLDHSTKNLTYIHARAGPRCQGSLQIGGPIEDKLEWEPRTQVLNGTRETWWGPPGDYRFSWDTVCAGLSAFSARILSFRPLPVGALSKDGTLPFPASPAA